jgi:hypothetical protein
LPSRGAGEWKEWSMVRVGLCRLRKMRGVLVEKYPFWEERGGKGEVD